MNIRLKLRSDAAACEQLVREVRASDGYPRYLPGDATSFITPPYESGAWVATDGDTLLGHVALHDAAVDPTLAAAQRATRLPAAALGVVSRLLVAPNFRRRGLGQALLSHAERQAQQRGQRAVLDVTQDAAPAIALYEAAGWSRLEPLTLTFADGTSLDLWVYLSPPTPPLHE